jgi:hypothetical protein
MEYRIRTDLARSAAVVALGVAASFVVSTVVAARAYRARGEVPRTLDVTGMARLRIRSDVAVWQVRVQGEGETLAAAFERLEAGMKGVRGFLGQREFGEAEVAEGAIGTETHYVRDKDGKETRQVQAYTLHRNLTVTTGRLERVEEAAGKVTELLGQGLLVVSARPEYYFTGIGDLKIELLAKASEDARARADAIAGKTGCRVAEVVDAHMGVLQVTEPHSTEVSSSGIYDTSTIEKDARAVVSVAFRIESP